MDGGAVEASVTATTAVLFCSVVDAGLDCVLLVAHPTVPIATMATAAANFLRPSALPYSRNMPVAFDLVTFDSPTPDNLASFWSSVLGMVETEREDGDRWIVLGTPDGVRRIGIQRGSTAVGSAHLDLACEADEFDVELTRLVGLGAEVVELPRHEPYGSIANLADPDGNPFDLCAYH